MNVSSTSGSPINFNPANDEDMLWQTRNINLLSSGKISEYAKQEKLRDIYRNWLKNTQEIKNDPQNQN